MFIIYWYFYSVAFLHEIKNVIDSLQIVQVWYK